MRHWTVGNLLRNKLHGRTVPTNEIETFAFGYRPNKDFYVTLHNKKKHAVACCPRVCTSHLCKTTVCYVVLTYNIPNHFREYRHEPRMHLITPPIQVLLVLFSKEKNEKIKTPTNY